MGGFACTFFGHRDCSESIRIELYNTIERIITEKGCRLFYVGNHGNFDRFVSKAIDDLKKKYNIEVYIVLAYMPMHESKTYTHKTVLPEGIEAVPKKVAIIYRNRWMVDKSDIVLTHVNSIYGGAAKFKEYAIKKGKQ